jgi:nucleotide-binding universal stress UspA family protein
MPVSIERSQEQALDYLCGLAEVLACEGAAATVSVEVGLPGPAILDAVMALHADLVVMGTHGREGVARWVLGSVAQHVSRYSPAPVLLVRPGGAGEALTSTAAGESPVRVLVPLDGSPLAETALGPAVALGRALSGTGRCAVHLLQVVDPRAAALDCIPEPVAVGRAEGYLARVAARLEAAPTFRLAAPVTTSVVVAADVAGGILRTAERPAGEGEADSARFDVAAMATHARGGLARWTLGSVTERVLHGGHLPLLIVRPAASAVASTIAAAEAVAFSG